MNGEENQNVNDVIENFAKGLKVINNEFEERLSKVGVKVGGTDNGRNR